jgi:hypothetical protein
MAARKVIVKLNHNEALVKCINDADSPATLTIGLSTDLLKSNEVLSGTPFSVGMSSIDAAIADLKEVIISRNGTPVVTLFENTNTLPFIYGADTEFSDSDLSVAFTGKGTVYIRLLKISGYTPKFQPERGIQL